MNAIARRRLRERSHGVRSSAPVLLVVLVGFFAFASVAVTAALGATFAVYRNYASAYTPIEQQIQQHNFGLTQIYDRGGPENGTLLGALTNFEAPLIEPIPLKEISPYLVAATISTEDNSFYEHPGVDPKGVLRAAWDNYVGGGVGSGVGGSTITQQLIKNVYLSDDCQVVEGRRTCVAPRTLDRKLKEVVFALKAERGYTKEALLGWYLNSISYADRYVGIESAAEGYFHKRAADLTLAESALLAGVPAAPTEFHPRLNCLAGADGQCTLDSLGRTTVGGAAKEREAHVLRLMLQHGRASASEVAAALDEPVYVYPAMNSILAPAWIDDQVEPRLVRMCEAGLLPLAPGTKDCNESVHVAAYKVTTTLDWAETTKAQFMMQSAIQSGLAAGCECHNAAVATIDPPTGQILVYAPTIDSTWVSDKRVSGNIDQLTEINQPGSSFKPAVYLAWMDKLGKVPLSSLWDTSPMPLFDKPAKPEDQVTILNPRPGNGGEGLITARAAMGGSQNVGAFRAAQEAGVENVIAVAKAMGITTLDQHFDPTFQSHNDVVYGPSIATGGANVRAIDMAYMNATIANMGKMAGVPTLAKTIDPGKLKSIAGSSGDDLDEAYRERLDFARGNTRLPGSRALDPVVVLSVRGVDGSVLYEHGSDLQKTQVVDAGSVWMVHSIMNDCTARFIIWTCGSSNTDLNLDFFSDGVKIPSGIKTGTQQGFANANDTLATWMNGYTRYAGTAVWVGNSDKSLVRDGATGGYASANTTIRLFKTWMGQFHHDLKEKGVFTTPAGFDELKPSNVTFKPFQSATTERGHGGGCYQKIDGWQRTDVDYKGGDCLGKYCVPLPDFKKDLAMKLAGERGISACGGVYVAASATESPTPDPSASPSASAALTTPAPSKTASPPKTPQASPTAKPTAAASTTPSPSRTPNSGAAAGPSPASASGVAAPAALPTPH
ncbi:MAG: transglycosylase domain-containing protein [Tepidiformaceae bacterium]